jgi:hypothetical protein
VELCEILTVSMGSLTVYMGTLTVSGSLYGYLIDICAGTELIIASQSSPLQIALKASSSYIYGSTVVLYGFQCGLYDFRNGFLWFPQRFYLVSAVVLYGLRSG